MATSPLHRILMVAALALSACAGCQKFALRKPDVPDVKPERKKRLAQAAQVFETQRNDAQLRAAQTYFAHDNLEICREQLESLLTREPDHREANFLIIDVKMRSGDEAGARAHAESLVERWPEDANAMHVLAQVYEFQGDETQAIACFERAASLTAGELSNRETTNGIPTPDPTATAALKATLLKAELCLALERPEEALVYLDSVLKGDADQAEANLLAGRVMESQGKPIDAVARYESAVSPGAEDDAQDELEHYESQATQLASNTSDVGDKARMIEPSRRDKGRTQGTKIIRISGETESDVSEQRTSELSGPSLQGPSRINAQVAAAKSRAQAASFNHQAEKPLAAKKAAAEAEARAVEAAVAALRRDDPDRAAQLAQSGLHTYPDSAALYRVLGTAEYRRSDYPASRRALERSRDLDGQQGLTYFLLGATHKKLGDADAAKRHFDRARQLDPRYGSQP